MLDECENVMLCHLKHIMWQGAAGHHSVSAEEGTFLWNIILTFNQVYVDYIV